VEEKKLQHDDEAAVGRRRRTAAVMVGRRPVRSSDDDVDEAVQRAAEEEPILPNIFYLDIYLISLLCCGFFERKLCFGLLLLVCMVWYNTMAQHH